MVDVDEEVEELSAVFEVLLENIVVVVVLGDIAVDVLVNIVDVVVDNDVVDLVEDVVHVDVLVKVAHEVMELAERCRDLKPILSLLKPNHCSRINTLIKNNFCTLIYIYTDLVSIFGKYCHLVVIW